MSKEWREDKRNVADFYRYWTEDAIKADLREKAHNFSVLITNQFKDFNIGTVIRNANAFCAERVIIYGSRQYDKRGTVGAHLYTNLKRVAFTDDLEEHLPADRLIVGVDNIEGAEPIETFEWPKDKHVVITLGEEAVGLTDNMIALCDKMVYIKQYGSVRSLNVGVASGIAMYDYCRKVVDHETV